LDGTEVVHSVIYDIIQKGGDAGKITKGAKKLKLEKGILLDNYVRRGRRLVDAQARSLLIYSRRSKRHMSLKKHKKCGSFDRWYIPQVSFVLVSHRLIAHHQKIDLFWFL